MAQKEFPELYPGWKTVRKIGSGSFGTVYEIERDLFGKIEKAALKYIYIPHSEGEIEELYGNGYDDASITAHFKEYLADIVREYSLMAEMKGHTNVVYCDDIRYIQHDEGFGWDIFIKMELLTPMLKMPVQAFSEEQVIRLGMDICRALVLCRDKGIVHRDIKPQNIFVSDTGDYKLGDFGIARTMERSTGATKTGTIPYMAPEVYNSQSYGSRADIYSLGLVLYWLMNERRLPFLPLPPRTPTVHDTDDARIRRLSGEAVPAPKNGSEELKAIVLRACAFNPEDRFQSAKDMLDALENIDLEKPTPQPKPVPKPAPEPEPTGGIVCGKCGYKNHAGETKCGGCGRDLTTKKPKLIVKKMMWIPVALMVLGVLALILGYFTIHFWTEGSCTKAAVCSICGKVKSEAPGHQWREATCTTAKICEICEMVSGKPLGHEWQEATCDQPKTCLECGSTKGLAKGHSWRAATCDSPSVCENCGEVTGEKLEHIWITATCEIPETCSLCGTESGEALGHVWIAPTFLTPQTCDRCSATEGESIPYENISVKDETLAIRDIYNEIVSKRDAGDYDRVQIKHGVVGYYDDSGALKCLTVYSGTDGIGGYSEDYGRWYYYDNDQLIFAFYDGKDAHRLYFYNGLLMRWRYRPVGVESTDSINYDFEFSDKYLELEKLALEEAYAYS